MITAAEYMRRIGDKQGIGKKQFDFLLEHGLSLDMKFLDIGCGSFRTGVHVISYLDDGNYYGIDRRDYSGNILQETRNFTFKQTSDFELFDIKFDMIFAWSVFTHLEDYQIEDCVCKVREVMNVDCKFFSSYFPPRDASNRFGRIRQTNNFCYPFSFFEYIADVNCLKIKQIEAPLNNENQRMLLWSSSLS